MQGKLLMNIAATSLFLFLASYPFFLPDVSFGQSVSFKVGTNVPVGINPTSVAVADFNGDGKPDLAVANNYLGTVSITLNTTHFSLAALLLPNGEAGVAYSAPLVTEGLGPYNFTLTKGTFPRGLTANTENGRLTGTPSLGKGRG
jgi:hypothetical protein